MVLPKDARECYNLYLNLKLDADLGMGELHQVLRFHSNAMRGMLLMV